MADELVRMTVKSFADAVEKDSAPENVLVLKGWIPDEIKSEGSKDLRKFSVVVSTGAVDRDGDTVAPGGWLLDNFRKAGGPVLFAHKGHELPIARTTNIGVSSGRLKALPEFPPRGVYPFADTVGDLVDFGALKGISAGFRPSKGHFRKREGGRLAFDKQELVEYSFVPIPANPEALLEAKSAGIELGAYVEWAERTLSEVKGAGLWLPREDVAAVLKIVSGNPVSVTVPAGVPEEPAAEERKAESGASAASEPATEAADHAASGSALTKADGSEEPEKTCPMEGDGPSMKCARCGEKHPMKIGAKPKKDSEAEVTKEVSDDGQLQVEGQEGQGQEALTVTKGSRVGARMARPTRLPSKRGGSQVGHSFRGNQYTKGTGLASQHIKSASSRVIAKAYAAGRAFGNRMKETMGSDPELNRDHVRDALSSIKAARRDLKRITGPNAPNRKRYVRQVKEEIRRRQGYALGIRSVMRGERGLKHFDDLWLELKGLLEPLSPPTVIEKSDEEGEGEVSFRGLPSLDAILDDDAHLDDDNEDNSDGEKSAAATVSKFLSYDDRVAQREESQKRNDLSFGLGYVFQETVSEILREIEDDDEAEQAIDIAAMQFTQDILDLRAELKDKADEEIASAATSKAVDALMAKVFGTPAAKDEKSIVLRIKEPEIVKVGLPDLTLVKVESDRIRMKSTGRLPD